MITFTYEDYCKYNQYLSVYTLNETDTPYFYNSVTNVHDKLYRDFFNDKLEFSLFLKHFLNKDISSDELIKYNNTFISEDYKDRHSDIVYKIKDKPIYILLEHQSTIDYSMNYRILEYYYYILRDTVDIKKLKRKNYKFPIIIPILLYTGNKKWDFVPNIGDKQVDCSDVTFPYKKLNFEYEFVDIHNYTLYELLNIDCMVSYNLAIDKCKSINELLDVLYKLCNIITDNIRKQHLKRLITHIFKDCLDEKAMQELVKKLNKGEDSNMKCSWDYIREDYLRQKQRARIAGLAEGRAEGMAKGRVEGRAEGRAEGKEEGKKEGFFDAIHSMITKMLENGESIDKIQLYSGFSIDEIEKIKKDLNLA